MERIAPRVHDLVRTSDDVWAVVCRERVPEGIPIGIRGSARSERHQLIVEAGAIACVVTPEQAAQRPAPREHPVFDALIRARRAAASLGLTVGAAGACGYELVTGLPALHAQSDLDLIVRTGFDDARLPLLAELLRDCAVRIDVEVLDDGGCGAALEEILRGGSVLVKTPDGPYLR